MARASDGQPGFAAPSDEHWSLNGDTLQCAFTVHSESLAIARAYALHRMRLLRARSRGFLHPLNIVISDRGVRIEFAAGALSAWQDPSVSGIDWVRGTLAPLVEASLACEEAGALWHGEPGIIAGQCVPSVRWFLPSQANDPRLGDGSHALQSLGSWIETGLRRAHLPDADRRLAEDAGRAIASGGWNGLRRWLDEWRVSERLGAHGVSPAGLVRCLTEFELFERVTETYRYRQVEPALARQFGIDAAASLVLRLERGWSDPHFGVLDRPTVQELWDELTEDSRTTPVVSLSGDVPNPIMRANSNAPMARWIGVHPDQPFVYLERTHSPVPYEGYIRPVSVGDDTLMERKRRFSDFVDRHPALRPRLLTPQGKTAFVANTIQRDELEDSILSTRGIFAVQGPPGTGKTFLAAQLVSRFLTQHPGGRVLVCSKEHFALDHIVKKISGTLEKAAVPFRAWRSQPLGRRRTQIEDSPWAATRVSRDLGERTWTPAASAWMRWQATTSDVHDLRVSTLGRDSANVVFTTTCDATMIDLLDRESFDLVVVEEAGKCYPSELLHALCLGRTTLMIGDQFQLPPYQEARTQEGARVWVNTIRKATSEAQRQALRVRFGDLVRSLGPTLSRDDWDAGDSLKWLRPFEYLFNRLPGRFRLTEQFRMEAPLSRVVGKVFYGEPFVHKKYEVPMESRPPERPLGDAVPARFDVPLLWLNTPHMTTSPEATEDQAKRGVRDNHYEVQVVVDYLRTLRAPSDLDLVILTPYRAQKRLLLESKELGAVCAALSSRPLDDLVRTTDEYQGREAELTVLSLVRNNSLGARAWGFMTAPERLNVMFSRARFRQVVVGCAAHIERHATECGHLHGVWDAYQAEAQNPDAARIVPSAEVHDG